MTGQKALRLVEEGKNQIFDLADKGKEIGFENTNGALIQWMVIIFVLALLYFLLTAKKGIIKGIKKELDIDDLKERIIEATELARKTGETNISNLSTISESIGMINVEVHSLKKELTKSFDEKSSAILEEIRLTNSTLAELIEAGKQFSNEEMYQLITNRFQLSITNIVDEFIATVDENDLFNTKDVLFPEIKDRIRGHIQEGRAFIYARNFDNRLLDVVFENTDNSISDADKALKKVFNEFYILGEENIEDKHYSLLKRKIRGIGKTIRLNSDNLLKRVLLRIERR